MRYKGVPDEIGRMGRGRVTWDFVGQVTQVKAFQIDKEEQGDQ
jgi:hypothetical protein